MSGTKETKTRIGTDKKDSAPAEKMHANETWCEKLLFLFSGCVMLSCMSEHHMQGESMEAKR